MQKLLSERSRVFEHADPFAVSGYINQHVGNHHLCLPMHSRPEASLIHRKFASLDLCRVGYGASVRVTSPALKDIYHLQVLLQGHCLWRGAGQEHYLVPGELLLINPDTPVDLTYSDDCEKFIVKIPTHVLEGICVEQRWTQPRQGLRFTENRYRLSELEGFLDLRSMICQEAEVSERLPHVEEHYQQIFALKLLTLFTDITRVCLPVPLTSFESIDDYIGRNLKQDIDLDELAIQAKMSQRSLYALFERHVQRTPRQYIRQRKLESVHAFLVDPNSNVRNVTELALDYGFLHLGRFSESYRQQFGELPSITLRRRC